MTRVQRATLKIQRGPTWRSDQLREAHAAMGANTAGGKGVVVVP